MSETRGNEGNGSETQESSREAENHIGEGDQGGGAGHSSADPGDSETTPCEQIQAESASVNEPNSGMTLEQSVSESSVNTEQNAEEPNEQNVAAQNDRVRFPRRRRSVGRQYRHRSGAGESSGDEIIPGRRRDSSSDTEYHHQWEAFLLSSSSSDSSQSSRSMDTDRRVVTEDERPVPKVLLKPKPRHKWFAVREIVGREVGYGGRWQGSERFQHRYYGSLHAVQRLELMYKLDKHRGCVNSLHFNRSGELLVSASDDKRVVLWDWAADKSILSYDSGHSGNVFQAKFLPLSGDRHIVTCARDGQVRLSVLSGVGVCKGTRLLAQHRRTTHKLAIHHDTPHVFLSAGEDALVLSHDVRTSKANKLLFVKEGSNKLGLYSIHSNPVLSNEFIVTGEDQYIRLYDKRKVSEGVTLNKFCPTSLLKPDMFLHITCAVFNYNGTEVIGSYNDDDIYLFDTRQPPHSDYVHKYEGHRNSITVKGINFFGPSSEFIVSGSDCGNIYFWDKNTESIVQWMRGDEEGVVNCLEPHPQVPIIATSGLDSDIKIWVPSCEQEPSFRGLKATVLSNQCDRDHTRGRRSDPFDNRQMQWLWRQIQHFEQRRVGNTTSTPREPGANSSTSDRDVVSSGSSSEDEAGGSRPQCSPS